MTTLSNSVALAFLTVILAQPALSKEKPDESKSLTLKSELPPAEGGTVEIQMKTLYQIAAEARKREEQAKASAQPAAAPAPSGLPPVPASVGGSAALSGNAPQSVQPNIQPGQPLKAYATLSQAAKDGVDPLGDLKREPTPVASSDTPQEWWARLMQAIHIPKISREDALKYGGVGLVALLCGVFYARRGTKSKEA